MHGLGVAAPVHRTCFVVRMGLGWDIFGVAHLAVTVLVGWRGEELISRCPSDTAVLVGLCEETGGLVAIGVLLIGLLVGLLGEVQSGLRSKQLGRDLGSMCATSQHTCAICRRQFLFCRPRMTWFYSLYGAGVTCGWKVLGRRGELGDGELGGVVSFPIHCWLFK